MSVKIRLRRMGAKKRPIYRLVATDSRMAREGRFIELLGHYNPLNKPATVRVNEEKIFKWLKQGAELSQTVHSLFAHIGLNEKWQLVKQGKDVSDLELKTVITERKKRTKKIKKAALAEAEAKEKQVAEAAKAKTEEKAAKEKQADEAAKAKTEEKAEEKTEAEPTQDAEGKE